jgi:16S rRNA (cytidine1402-2'-O)-methyltransferase
MTPPQTPGKLYLVPNTLDFGVSSDAAPADLQTVLPLQALQIAARLTHWVAENAKTTRSFLKRVDAVVPLSQALQALHIVQLPRPQKGSKTAANIPLDLLLAPALQGLDTGLISEAGLPAVADPGAALVEAAHRLGVTVIPLSGPSSLLMALSASGLNGQSFAFVGYLPVEATARTAALRELEALSRRHQQTQLMIETPYRNQALLAAMLAGLTGNCRLSVSCGLTLAGGWTRTDTVAAWKQRPVNLPNDIPAVFALLGV